MLLPWCCINTETSKGQGVIKAPRILWKILVISELTSEFSRQEYWNGLPFPAPRDLPNPGANLGSPALQADSLPSEPPGKALKSEEHRPKDVTLINEKAFCGTAQMSTLSSDKLILWHWMTGSSNLTRHTQKAAGTNKTQALLSDPATRHTVGQTPVLNLCHISAQQRTPRSRKVRQLATANKRHQCLLSSVRSPSSLRSFLPLFNRAELAFLYGLY